MTRTPEETKARLQSAEGKDWMGSPDLDLILSLPFESAKEYLNDAYIAGVEAGTETYEPPQPDEAAREYMKFALGKCLDHRGLSAARSVGHYRAWFWLIGDDAYASVDWDDYAMYGAPILRSVAKFLNLDSTLDTEDFAMFSRMAEGKPCTDDCMEGCG